MHCLASLSENSCKRVTQPIKRFSNPERNGQMTCEMKHQKNYGKTGPLGKRKKKIFVEPK